MYECACCYFVPVTCPFVCQFELNLLTAIGVIVYMRYIVCHFWINVCFLETAHLPLPKLIFFPKREVSGNARFGEGVRGQFPRKTLNRYFFSSVVSFTEAEPRFKRYFFI